jgi:hypothetical protein
VVWHAQEVNTLSLSHRWIERLAGKAEEARRAGAEAGDGDPLHPSIQEIGVPITGSSGTEFLLVNPNACKCGPFIKHHCVER